MPLLFATSGYLSAASGRQVVLARRMRRILVPYCVLSVVFLCYDLQSAWRGAELNLLVSNISVGGVIFAGQASYTLWFLAMLVYVTLIGCFLRTPRLRLYGAVTAIAIYAGITAVIVSSSL